MFSTLRVLGLLLTLLALALPAVEMPDVVEPGGSGDGELVNVDSAGGATTDSAVIVPGGGDPSHPRR